MKLREITSDGRLGDLGEIEATGQCVTHPDLTHEIVVDDPQQGQFFTYVKINHKGRHKQVVWTFFLAGKIQSNIIMHLGSNESRWILIPNSQNIGCLTSVQEGWISGDEPSLGAQWTTRDQSSGNSVIRTILYNNPTADLIAQHLFIKHAPRVGGEYWSRQASHIPSQKEWAVDVVTAGEYAIIESQAFVQKGSLYPRTSATRQITRDA